MGREPPPPEDRNELLPEPQRGLCRLLGFTWDEANALTALRQRVLLGEIRGDGHDLEINEDA